MSKRRSSEILRLPRKLLKIDSNSSLRDSSPVKMNKPPNSTYKGKSPDDAGALLDASQGEFGLNSYIPGHARAHVFRGSNKVEARELYCVENFSLASSEPKTAFFLRKDQNKFVHKALTSSQGQEKLRCLNNPGKYEVMLCASMTDFTFCGGLWENGELIDTFKPDRGIVVLQHKRRNKDPCRPNTSASQDVHIFTAYPLVPKKTDKKEKKSETPGGTSGGNKSPDCPPGCDTARGIWLQFE